MMMMGGMGGGSMSGGSMGGSDPMSGMSMGGGSMGNDQMMMDMMNKMDMMMNKMNMMSMGGMNMGGGMNMTPTNMGGMNMAPMNMGQSMGYMDPNAMAHGTGGGVHGATSSFGALDITSLLTGLFNFAISIFALLLVVGLIVGAVVFLKRYLIDGMSGMTPARKLTNTRACTKCSATVNDAFNFCPVCGESKVVSQPTQA